MNQVDYHTKTNSPTCCSILFDFSGEIEGHRSYCYREIRAKIKETSAAKTFNKTRRQRIVGILCLNRHHLIWYSD